MGHYFLDTQYIVCPGGGTHVEIQGRRRFFEFGANRDLVGTVSPWDSLEIDLRALLASRGHPKIRPKGFIRTWDPEKLNPKAK